MTPTPRDAIELELFVRALRQRHGYDFSQYAHASLKRRVQTLVDHFGLANISQLTERILHCDDYMPEVIARLSVPVSDMFRDPEVFACLRREVFPVLASYPHINIWQAGCAHGEEVYSLAILLSEAGLYERTRIYATDISTHALERAREGIYASRNLHRWAAHYLEAGGTGTLSDYFHARYGHIKIDTSLRRNLIFSTHNLATDTVFCEAQLILCRNVLIYFQPTLQQHAITLFRASLARGGYLCLGTKESLSFTEHGNAFTALDPRHSIYRLVGSESGAR